MMIQSLNGLLSEYGDVNLQWYLLRAAAQLDVKIALFVNGFVVYRWNEPDVSSHLPCTATYEVAAHRRDHCITFEIKLEHPIDGLD